MEVFILFLASVAAAGMVHPPPAESIGTGSTEAQRVENAIVEFEPYLIQQFDVVRDADPEALTVWQTAVAWIPYLTESVAGWYALQDPEVPNEPKLIFAGALLGLARLAMRDPKGFLTRENTVTLSGAIYSIYEYIEPKHIELAKKWLESHGVKPNPLFGLGKRFEKFGIDDPEESEALHSAIRAVFKVPEVKFLIKRGLSIGKEKAESLSLRDGLTLGTAFVAAHVAAGIMLAENPSLRGKASSALIKLNQIVLPVPEVPWLKVQFSFDKNNPGAEIRAEMKFRRKMAKEGPDPDYRVSP